MLGPFGGMAHDGVHCLLYIYSSSILGPCWLYWHGQAQGPCSPRRLLCLSTSADETNKHLHSVIFESLTPTASIVTIKVVGQGDISPAIRVGGKRRR